MKLNSACSSDRLKSSGEQADFDFRNLSGHEYIYGLTRYPNLAKFFCAQCKGARSNAIHRNVHVKLFKQ